jgi:hypothetical protein
MQLYGYCRARACTEPGPEHIPIKDTRYLASYNWVDKDQPTIVIPGTSICSLEPTDLMTTNEP